jgi:hypothetical protein
MVLRIPLINKMIACFAENVWVLYMTLEKVVKGVRRLSNIPNYLNMG